MLKLNGRVVSKYCVLSIKYDLKKEAAEHNTFVYLTMHCGICEYNAYSKSGKEFVI